MSDPSSYRAAKTNLSFPTRFAVHRFPRLVVAHTALGEAIYDLRRPARHPVRATRDEVSTGNETLLVSQAFVAHLPQQTTLRP